jgi:hypothetical protein
MRKLIPNNITVSEQFRIRAQFVSMVGKWRHSHLPVNIEFLQNLEEASGVRCHYASMGQLAGFKLVDEKAYAWFVLRWS